MTTISTPTRKDLLERKAEILADLGLTEHELVAKRRSGALVGTEWSAWSEVVGIDYLLEDDAELG